MKVLLLTHICPPALDGGSKVIHSLGNELRRRGHVTITLSSNCYSTDDFSRLFPHTHQQGIPVVTIFHRPFKLLSRHISFLKPFSIGPLFSPLHFFLKLITIIRFRPDLIIAGPLPTSIVVYARFIKKITKSRLLINASFHPTDPVFHNPLLIECLQSADYLWTLTDSETNYFNTDLMIPNSKLINIGNGITTKLLTKLPFHHQPGHILFIGSFSAHKGLETLFKAYALLKPQHPQLRLTLAGQRTLYSQNLKIPRSVIVINHPTDSQLQKLINSATMIVLPSSQESFGLVLLESWARKKPVITSDVPALLEIVTKSHGGLTFVLNDHHSLSRSLNRLLTSPRLCCQLALNGYRYTQQHYTWDKITDSLCAHL